MKRKADSMSGKRINKHSVDEHYVRPQAAWEQMKAARNTGQTVYIYGTTGIGKTSFVVDFLARKQYCYLSVTDTDVVDERMAGFYPAYLK